MAFSVSATSRAARGTEQHGKEYFFLSPTEFRAKIKEEAFLEYEEVYKDTYYGTLKSVVEEMVGAGRNVVFDVDVVGGINIKKFYGDRALSVFIMPPGLETLRERLISRGTDAMEVINKRLAKAEYEISFAQKFDVIIRNEVLETAEEEALKEAKDLIKKLDEGAKFEELAKENSDDGTASEGGLYANFTKTQVVTEFWDASIALKDGEYSKTPVKTQYGYHIILRISQEKKPSLDDALDTVKEALVEEKMKETNASLKVWAKLRKQYNINIYDTDINRIYRSTTNNY